MKVKYGLCNVHIAKMSTNENGDIVYDKPFRIPGAVNLTLSAEGDKTPFYADNSEYHSSYANQGYTGDLEIADIPEKFRIDILGEKKDKNGALLEVSNVTAKHFALMYQVETDESGRRFVYYNTTVSRPSTEAHTTEEANEPKTDTMSITTSPRPTDEKVRMVLEKTAENEKVYNTFFDEVYEEDKTIEENNETGNTGSEVNPTNPDNTEEQEGV